MNELKHKGENFILCKMVYGCWRWIALRDIKPGMNEVQYNNAWLFEY